MEENSTTNITMNDTLYDSLHFEENFSYQCIGFPINDIAFAGVYLAISLCGLAGNGVVMWFLGFHTKQSPFTVYILNLAVADFSLLLLFLLIFLVFLTIAIFCISPLFYTHHYMRFKPVLVFLCLMFNLSSLGLLTALSVERCLSVLCPIWYRCHRPRHLSGIVSGALWALSGILVLSLYVTSMYTRDYKTVVLAGIALSTSMAISLMMVISNLFLFLKLCCGSQRQQPRRLFVVILINVLVFFAFGIPFCIEIFLPYMGTGRLYPGYAGYFLAVLNSSLNPVIYVLVGSCQRCHFQLSIRVALRRVFEEKARSDEGSHSHRDTVVHMRAL